MTPADHVTVLFGATGDLARRKLLTGLFHLDQAGLMPERHRIVGTVAAALIMIGMFGGFVLDNDPIVKSIGVSLAFGVLADAFIVRMTPVPAVMALLGRGAWWLPSRVGRIVPNVDIEGEKLLKGLEQAPART